MVNPNLRQGAETRHMRGAEDRRCDATSTSREAPCTPTLDTLVIAGGRVCSASTRLAHPVITNQTSPHFAETLLS
jgi:hypothetical protein